MKSQQVVCCGARTWVLGIGWLQTLLSGFLMGFFTVFLVWFAASFINNHSHIQEQINKNPDRKAELEKHLLYAAILTVSGFLVVIIAFMIGFIGGILLIKGVKQKSAQKLKLWMLIELIYLVFILSAIVLGSLGGIGFYSLLVDTITVLPAIFFLWIVNVHRQELLGNSAGHVSSRSVV